ncbi:hypothetical protein [Salinispira pacifica]
MERHLLIAGRGSAVLDALAQEARSAKDRLLRTLDAGQEKPLLPEGQTDSTAYTIWNRRSPLSARSVVIRATNVLEKIDEAFIVFSSADDKFSPFHELSPADIELRVDSDVKGYIFLVKEIVAQFSRQGSGAVSLVLQYPASSLGSPIGAAAVAAFRSIGEQLFNAYQNEPFSLRGFESTSDDAKEFARYLFTAGQEKAEKLRGRWHRYGGKSGLFSFGR